MTDLWTDGDAYEKFMGRWSRALAARLVEWARISPGGTVLDVGSGTGSLTRALLAAGAGAVVGVDMSPAFVAEASRRIGREHSNARFQVGDAADLPLPIASFDAAASCLALNFVPDPLAAISEMARVVRPGGILAACVWDYAGGMAMLRRFWDAAIALDLPRAKELDESRKFPICAPGRLEEAFRRFSRDVEGAPIDVPMTFRDLDDYWTPFLAGVGPAGSFAASLPEGDRTRMREHFRAHIPAEPDGTIRMVSRAWAVRARRD
jgi:SAM-dependent methyltransferase